MKQWTSCELLFSDVWTQWKMLLFVPSVGPCMQHNYWCDFRKASIPWLCAAYNFGCRALYNLPWRASVSSYQVQCNIPTLETLLKKCVSVSWTMQRVNNVWLRAWLQSDCLCQYYSLLFEHYNRILLCDWVPGRYSVSLRMCVGHKPFVHHQDLVRLDFIY